MRFDVIIASIDAKQQQQQERDCGRDRASAVCVDELLTGGLAAPGRIVLEAFHAFVRQ